MKLSNLSWAVSAGVLFLMLSTGVYAKDGKEDSDDLQKITSGRSVVDSIPSETLSERSFEVLFEQNYPASEEMLLEIRDKTKLRNNVLMDNPELEALTEIIQVSTVPGAQPPTIIVAPLHVTTLNVIDSTGNAWPLSVAIPGNDTDYSVEAIAPHDYKNAVKITPTLEVGSTNIVLSLVGLPTTITINIKNSTERYHPSPILQIDRPGPHAKPAVSFNIGSVNQDEILKNIVLGLAPEGYKKLETSDASVEAWRHSESLYIRTRYVPSSPLPRSIFHGPGGYAAYKLAYMPVLGMTDSLGNMKRIYIGGPK